MTTQVLTSNTLHRVQHGIQILCVKSSKCVGKRKARDNQQALTKSYKVQRSWDGSLGYDCD